MFGSNIFIGSLFTNFGIYETLVFSDAMTMIKLSNNNRTTFYVDNVLHSHYNLCLMGYDLPTNLLNSSNKETVKANNVE